MNINAMRGRGIEPLLTRFVVLCVLQVSVAALIVTQVVMKNGWPRLAALALAVLAIGAGVVLFLTARKAQRSLATLRGDLDRLAQSRFPAIVDAAVRGADVRLEKLELPASSDTQVATLATGIDVVCASAVRLASERDEMRSGYAEVFVNMFRRTQTLLLRQLQIIEGFERSNRSPSDLNRFYQLDHLVMRMRRNNENILVLSGTELVRKTKEPVPVSDLLRASISEIDNYQRVRLLSTPSIRVANTAAGDLIRIVAELLDNATSFSSPEKQVTVKAELGRHHGLSIGVIDNGIGMSDEDIRKANDQLRRLGSAEIARARRLGLLVVGRLAGRHGFRVELFGGDQVQGVSALVSVPSSVLLEEDAVRATLPGDLNRGSTMGPRGGTANRAGRGASAVPMTITVRKKEGEVPAKEHPRRQSSWYSRPRPKPVQTLRQADLVAQAHSDVPGDLPVRVPKPDRKKPTPVKQADRAASRWFQARSSIRQQDGSSPSPPPAWPTTTAENWKSNVDQAWEKAENARRADGYTYTEDGLPLREKGAHLIAGSVSPVSADGTRGTAKPIVRDAKNTRHRLSSYQQGVQKAKDQEARMRETKQTGGWTILEIDKK